MESGDFKYICSLGTLPMASRAQQWLERLAEEFGPIMRASRIKGHGLAETIHPTSLGDNATQGFVIELRLREKDDLSKLLPEADVVGEFCRQLATTVHNKGTEDHRRLTELLRNIYAQLYPSRRPPPVKPAATTQTRSSLEARPAVSSGQWSYFSPVDPNAPEWRLWIPSGCSVMSTGGGYPQGYEAIYCPPPTAANPSPFNLYRYDSSVRPTAPASGEAIPNEVAALLRYHGW